MFANGSKVGKCVQVDPGLILSVIFKNRHFFQPKNLKYGLDSEIPANGKNGKEKTLPNKNNLNISIG